MKSVCFEYSIKRYRTVIHDIIGDLKVEICVIGWSGDNLCGRRRDGVPYPQKKYNKGRECQ
jgi:hypothetical protein